MTDRATKEPTTTVQTRNVPLTEEELEEYQEHRDAGTFSRDSLTSGDKPYTRLPMRREVSPKIRKRAKLAASFLLMEGRGANERVVICQSTPQWVCDVVNRSADVNGVVDQWRQKFAFESLKMVRAGSPPSVATSDNLDDLRAWEGATDAKRRYVEKARTMLESPSETQLLQTAQRFERFEVYFQVYETLEDAPYDGSLYDIERVRRRKAAES